MVVGLANDELEWMKCQDLPLFFDRQATRIVDFKRNFAVWNAVQGGHNEFLSGKFELTILSFRFLKCQISPYFAHGDGIWHSSGNSEIFELNTARVDFVGQLKT